MRRREDFAGGQVENDPLSASELDLISAGLAVLPEISASNNEYIPIILDPDGVFGDPEVVFIDSHGPSSTSATLVAGTGATPGRAAFEGTTPREHPQDTPWVHGPTVVDVEAFNPVDEPSIAPTTIDDEFDTTSLDPKWTVHEGSLGTVSLLSGVGGTYDLTTRPNCLLVQPDNGSDVFLRQDAISIADGESVIGCFSPAFSVDAGAVVAGDIKLGFVLNDDDADPDGASLAVNIGMFVQVGSVSGWAISFNAGGLGIDFTSEEMTNFERVYLRVARSGNDYYGFWSFDGVSWNAFDTEITSAVTHDNLWIYATASNTNTPIPIQSVHWIRVGTNDLDPW